MKRAWIIGVVVVAAVSAAGVLFGRDLYGYYRFGKALDREVDALKADAGPWPQPQETCFICHGPRGQSGNGGYPALSGQPAAYLEAQLRAFASDRRPDPSMGPLARGMDEQQMKLLAAYFARQAPVQNEKIRVDAALAARGMTVVQARSCVACHGAGLAGNERAPRLAGQGEAYLADQLVAFRAGKRHDETGAMNGVAAALSDEDIRAVAHYLASIVPAHAAAATASTDRAPRLANHDEADLVKQITAIKTGNRADSASAMHAAVARLSGDDIRAVAYYLANVSSGHEGGSVR
ncbi:c-type cytochrome [Burkholderia lata]|uniref:Cytochrome c, class I n=1 Tax=Burkholderia lata (strain ATCC 17760 / DSM 23089 / LMG 22485 / NCIMB 9086 / R18194 / 383) TaxID=482957 RepID=Q39NU0_BURL3|nr:Cytochrome c, class I [Burkholderia lata]